MNLYSEIILDLNKNPKNYRIIKGALEIDAINSLCGDAFKIYCKISNNIIEDISFQGKGCAISTASSSLMTEILQGKSLPEALEIIREIVKMSRGEEFDKNIVGKMKTFSSIKDYPSRVKCLTLSWHGIKATIKQKIWFYS